MQSLGAAGWNEDETLRMLRNHTPMPDSTGNVRIHDGNIAVKIMGLIAEDIPSSQNHEALAIQLVRQQTRIPTPRLYQAYSYHTQWGIIYLIMDYVRGERLDHAWPKLSWCARARVAWTLRSYVRQLRRIKMEPSHFPGPLGPRSLPCQGYMWETNFGRDAGPFLDATAMFTRLENYSFRLRDPDFSGFDGFAEPQPLVFAHNDLCLRNIVLGEDGQVWIIDWGFAGFYPEFFEYANMDMAANCDPNEVPLSWKRCIPFITDPYHARSLWLTGFYY